MKIAEELKDNFVEDMELLASVWCCLSDEIQDFLSRALAGDKGKEDFQETMTEFSMGIHTVETSKESLEDMVD